QARRSGSANSGRGPGRHRKADRNQSPDRGVFSPAIFFGSLRAGSIVYFVFVILAPRSYLAQPVPEAHTLAPISVLKPLAGVDEGLEINLRTFFEQDHPDFELLFAVREADDPAIEVVQTLQKQFPARASRLIVTGEPPYPN